MIDETLLEAEEKMEKAIEVAKEDFATIRTGTGERGDVQQAHRRLLRHARRRSSSSRRSHVPEARTIIITPYDKGSLRAIEKAIRDSDLGVNPTNDGNVIRVNLPQLTEERRKEYIKLARAKAEDAKVSIRNIRRKAKEALDKLGRTARSARTTSTGAEKELDAITKKHTDAIDELLKHKEAELLEV